MMSKEAGLGMGEAYKDVDESRNELVAAVSVDDACANVTGVGPALDNSEIDCEVIGVRLESKPEAKGLIVTSGGGNDEKLLRYLKINKNYKFSQQIEIGTEMLSENGQEKFFKEPRGRPQTGAPIQPQLPIKSISLNTNVRGLLKNYSKPDLHVNPKQLIRQTPKEAADTEPYEKEPRIQTGLARPKTSWEPKIKSCNNLLQNPQNDVVTGLGSDDRSCKIQKLVGSIDKKRQRSIATRPSTDGQTGPLAYMPMPVNLGMFNSLNSCKTHKTFNSYTGSNNLALPGEFKSCREDPTGDYRYLQNQRSYNPESLKQNLIQKT
jgi:hypothetical protein